MSLSINSNLSALTALDNLNSVDSQLSVSVNRLSSGLKINSAGDDPAGLVMSQRMQTQIAGIGQAITNSQSAMNMTKTADGGLTQIESLLQSLRTLAVASANTATLSSAEVQANQQQVTDTVQSIDKLVGSTQWAGQNLLDGTAGVQAAVTDPTDVAGVTMTGTFGGQPVASGPVTVQLTTKATQTTLTTNQAFTGLSSIVPQGAFTVNGLSFTSDGATTTVQGMLNQINSESQETGVVASVVPSGSNISLQLQSTQYGSKFPISVTDSSHLFDSATNPPPTVAGQDAVATVTAPITTATGPSTLTETFTGGLGSTGSGLEMADSSGNIVTLSAAGNNGSNLTNPSQVGSVSTGALTFQTGAGSGQIVSVNIPNMGSTQLGTIAIAGQSISTLNVTTQQGAQQAIQIVDAAITQLTAVQGNIGAFQASLVQPNINLLSTASENLAAANSDVSDTDIAAEMTTYTKNQILEQSGIAILAQANQSPQQVLQLLKA